MNSFFRVCCMFHIYWRLKEIYITTYTKWTECSYSVYDSSDNVMKSLQNRHTKNLGHDSSLMYDTDLNTATNIIWSQWSVSTFTKKYTVYIYIYTVYIYIYIYIYIRTHTHTHVYIGSKTSVYLQGEPQCLKMHYFITMSIICKTRLPVRKVSNFDTELSFELRQNTKLVPFFSFYLTVCLFTNQRSHNPDTEVRNCV